MSPIHRYHDRAELLVPPALVEAVDSAFGVSDYCGEDYALYPEEAAALEWFCAPLPSPLIIGTPVLALTRARNVLDTWTLATECTSEQDDWALAVGCDFCLWCQALVLRDWCDEVLDRAGFSRPAYLDEPPADADNAALYEATWRDVNALYAAAGAES